jgi:hypothetical protein
MSCSFPPFLISDFQIQAVFSSGSYVRSRALEVTGKIRMKTHQHPTQSPLAPGGGGDKIAEWRAPFRGSPVSPKLAADALEIAVAKK